ncbi:MAG: hemolysin activation/secretion protein [Verrucomicrobiales bacterium]
MTTTFTPEKPLIAFLITGLAFVFGPGAWAQGEGELVERVKEQREEALPDAGEGGSQQLPDVPEPDGEADDTPLDIEIQAFKLIAHQDRADVKGAFEIESPVMVDEDLLPPEGLSELLEAEFVGEQLSMAMLEAIPKAIIEAYREGDYPLVDAYFPEQDITTGKIQVVVREALLGKLKVDGAEGSTSDYLMKQIRVAPGERINSTILEGDIDWMNSSPARRIDLIYERGEEDGTSDIILKSQGLPPVGAYVSYGNTGVEATGVNEWATGFNISSLFGSEHDLGYSFSGDAELDNLNAHTVIYGLPLPWRHRLQFIGAYVTSQSGAGSAVLPLDVDGESIQGSANYKIILPKIDIHRQNLTLGIDYKSTNTDILFGGQTFFDSVVEVFQFRAGYDLTVSDKLGYTRFDVGAVFSPGDMLNSNNDEAFQALRDQSTSDYWYLSGEVERYVKLPKDWGLKLTVEGQFTDDRLVSTEQLLAGGYRSLRGVDENIARGDTGIVSGLELIAPRFSIVKKKAAAPGEGEDPAEGEKAEAEGVDTVGAFAFVDSAWLYSNGDFQGEPDQSLQTTGLGVNYRFGKHASLRASYGWVLNDSGLEEVGEGKWHFGFTMSY